MNINTNVNEADKEEKKRLEELTFKQTNRDPTLPHALPFRDQGTRPEPGRGFRVASGKKVDRLRARKRRQVFEIFATKEPTTTPRSYVKVCILQFDKCLLQ